MVTIKYFVLGTSILLASKNIHERMVEGIVRSPVSFFDSISSGTLINKFSNDLGVIDHSLFYSFVYSLEGITIFLVAAVNLCQINSLMIVPTLFVVIGAIWLFAYVRPAIIKCKDLDLQKKSPIFHKSSELINGLVQIRLHGLRIPQIKSFGSLINDSSRAEISFEMVSRAFGVLETLLVNIFTIAGIILGIAATTD